MNVIFDVVVPIFGVALIGFAAAKIGIFKPEATRELTGFVFKFAIPVLLFRTLAQTVLPEVFAWELLLAYYLSAWACYGIGMFLGGRLFKQRLDERGIFGLGSSYANLVLLGIPLCILAYGDDAALPAFLILAFQSTTLFPIASLVAEAGRHQGGGGRKLLKNTFLGLIKNPIVDSLVLGLLFNLLNLAIPVPIDNILELLGRAALPCALFAMGSSLAAYRLAGHIPEASTLIVVKLFLHPLLVWILAFHVFDIERLWASVAVVLAAMPVGVNSYVYAHRYNVVVAPVATAVLVSTGLSILTTAVLLNLLGTP